MLYFKWVCMQKVRTILYDNNATVSKHRQKSHLGPFEQIIGLILAIESILRFSTGRVAIKKFLCRF